MTSQTPSLEGLLDGLFSIDQLVAERERLVHLTKIARHAKALIPLYDKQIALYSAIKPDPKHKMVDIKGPKSGQNLNLEPVVCPECGQICAGKPSLGSHRRKHGVKGSSAIAIARREEKAASDD